MADQRSHRVPNVHNITPERTPEVDPWLHSESRSKILFISFGSTPLCICLSWSRDLLKLIQTSVQFWGSLCTLKCELCSRFLGDIIHSRPKVEYRADIVSKIWVLLGSLLKRKSIFRKLIHWDLLIRKIQSLKIIFAILDLFIYNSVMYFKTYDVCVCLLHVIHVMIVKWNVFNTDQTQPYWKRTLNNPRIR